MSSGSTEPTLPHADFSAQVENAAALFEEAWQRGEDPAIEPFLPGESAARRAVLVELVNADLEFRLKSGRRVRVEYYLGRFPELREMPHHLLDLVAAEYEFRKRREPGVSLAEYLERFPEWRAELPGRLLLGDNAGRASVLNSHDATVRSGEPLPGLAEAFPQAFSPQFPHYEILGELGRGGMGVVYKARDRRRGTIVALKTLQWVDAGALFRFKQEFRALADVVHPNLVSLHELVSDGERWFFTMELIDGENFYAYVRPSHEPWNADQATQLEDFRSPNSLSKEQLQRLRGALVQLAEGLTALHEAGKLHRDIKPYNVLVSREGRVVLLDFGLAADLGRMGLHHSTEQHIVGTVSYMSPEQAQALPLTPATDWFSVGVMLYEALTGSLPKLDRSSLPLPLRPPTSTTERLKTPLELVPETPPDLNELCLALLSTEPESRPSGPEVLRRLKGTYSPSAPPAPRPARHAAPFVGREAQLGELREALAAVHGGKTKVVFVHGRSGAGKSALVQHFLDEVEAGGPTVVLAGRCYERESVPYKALDSAIDALCKYLRQLPPHEAEALLPRHAVSLARVFPVLRRVPAFSKAGERGSESPDPQETRRRASAALRELLGRIGERKSLVLYIDDLQWGDADSADFLTELLRPPDSPELLFLASYRSEDTELSPLLAKLRQTRGNVAPLVERGEISLDTLSPAEAAGLARALLGSEGEAAREQSEAIARESRGNPYFVQELVQYVRQGAGLAEHGSASGELLLDKMLWERVQRLPEESRRLLEVLAVAGQPLDLRQAAQAAQTPHELRPAIVALRAEHLVRAGGGAEESRIEPYHDRVREAILSQLSTDQLRAYHARLAETLSAERNADPERLAIHYRGAGQDERAGACFAEAAAAAADALAFDHAAQLYRLSLRLRPVQGIELQRILERLGDALANAGRGSEAAAEFLRAAALADNRESLMLRRRAAEQYMVSGHIDEGLETLRVVLAAVGLKLPATPRRALVSLLANRARLWLRGHGFAERDAAAVPPEEIMRIDACWSVTAGLSLVDTIRGADFQTRHLLYALRAGEPGRVARALAFEAGHLAAEGSRHASRAETLLTQADRLAEKVGSPYPRATATAARGIVSALLGRWPEARTCSDAAEAIFRQECTGVAWELSTSRRFAFWARIYMGELAEISRRIPPLLKDARERNDLYAITNLNNVVLPMLYLAADEPDRIAAEVYAAEAPARDEFHVQHYARLSDLSQTDLYCGRGREAWERIEAQWPRLTGSFLLRVQQIRIFMHFLRGRAALSAAEQWPASRAALLEAARRDADKLTTEKVPWSAALGRLLEACGTLARGNKDTAAAQFADAANRLDEVSMALHAAAARRRLASLVEGEDGERLLAGADEWMNGQSIKNPALMANMLAPGSRFDRAPP